MPSLLDPVPRFEIPEPPPAPPGLRLSFRAVAAFALALLALFAVAKLGRHWWTVTRFIESTDDAYVGGDITVLAPKVSGFIARVAVADNQPVHAGDLLIQLDDRDYRAALARAEATVAIQQAVLTNLDATLYLQDALVAQAQAEIDSADAEISRARDDRARYAGLLAKAAVSTQNFQTADAASKQAIAAGARARAAFAAVQRQLNVIRAQKLQAQATLAQAAADRELAPPQSQLHRTPRPHRRTVGNRSARPGAYAAAGSQLLALTPARGLWVDANFKENQLARIQPGSPATVEVDLWPGRPLRGHVASLAPATGAQFSVLPPENATGNFTKIVQRVAVRILLDDETAAGALRPGLSVTARVDGRPAARRAE